MDHPFEVGGTFRNRDGEYEVVEIDGPDMVIRYLDGRRLETSVKLQARIWKHIRAEKKVRSQRRESAPARKPRGGRTTRLGRLVAQNLDHVFIAYAFSCIDGALEALEDAPKDVEGVVVQPHYAGRIKSAKDAMVTYRALTDGRDIPILFTPQTRYQDQVFEYGSRVLDLCHETEIGKVRTKVDAGKWFVWDKSLYASNFLIVKTPIKELAVKPPIEVATNVLGGATQGEPVEAVAIPAPKALDLEHHHLLEDL